MCIKQCLSCSNSFRRDQDSLLIKTDPYLQDTDDEDDMNFYIGITMDPGATSVGFVGLPRESTATFGAIREVIQRKTVLPSFEFMLPSGYPISPIQEKEWKFNKPKFCVKGDGSFVNPYQVRIRETTAPGIKQSQQPET